MKVEFEKTGALSSRRASLATRIPEGWSTQRVKDIGRVITGKTPPTKESKYFGKDYPFIKIPDMGSSVRIKNAEKMLSHEGAQYMCTLRLPPGSVMVSCLATIGKVGITAVDSFTNQQINSIIPDVNEVIPEWVYYYFKNNTEYLENLGGGGSVYTNISKSRFENAEITVPPIIEQRAMVKILSDLDAKIELNRRMNETLEHIARAIFKKWFVDSGVNSSWTKGRLIDICDRITKGTTPTTMKKSFCQEGINFIKAESIDDHGNLLRDKFAYIDNSTNSLLSRSALQENDILYTIAGTIGRTAVVNSDHLPANTNQAVAIIRLRNKPLYLSYVRLLFKTSEISENFKRRVVQAVQANLSLGEISEAEILIPDEQILRKFNQAANSIFLQINNNSRQINILAEIRDTLLPKLMSGEIRVNTGG